jgi:rhodanese-related sulfurtransferase
MLLLSSKAEFVQQLTGHSAAPPAYFSHDAVLNQIERPTLEENLQVQHRPLTLDQAREHIQQGATVLDVRHPDEFVAGHYPGSVNIGLDGRFAEWAGSVIDLEKPVLVIAPPGREEEAIVRLNRVGFEDIAGYLPILPDEFTATQPRIQAAELARQLQGPDAPLVFDVRTPAEFAKGHLPGARNVPLQQLEDQIPTEGPVVIHCQSGYRSSIATSLVGPREGLIELQGGYLAWTEAGLPVERT